jgi:peroxiredoxin
MRTIVVALCLLWAMPAGLPAMGQTPDSASPTTRQVRPPVDVIRDWRDNSRRLRELLPSPRAIMDVDKRAEVAPLSIPLLWRGVRLADEMAVADPASRDDSARLRFHFLAILSFLDDPAAARELATAKESNHRQTAMLGRDATFLAQWWKSGDDPKSQNRTLDDIAVLVKESPADDDLTHLLAFLRDEGAADDSIVRRIESIIMDDLRGPVAIKLGEQFKIHAKLRAMVDKPLVLSGIDVDGKAFTTAHLAGKVVLIDFGATWCQPWTEQLTELRKLQADRAGRGLAIVTVLCDENAQNVRDFLAREPIAWPVVRDPEKPVLFAAQYGVELLPTIFLIDRKGVLRHVDAAAKLQILAEQLLQEADAAPATQPASQAK